MRWAQWVEPAHSFDATQVGPGLFIGSRPVHAHGFDVLVLCAREIQDPDDYQQIEVVLAPMDDSTLRTDFPQELSTALRARDAVLRALRKGQRVLVTCRQGRNRSGLVCALVLRELTGWPGKMIVSHLRNLRPGALSNPVYAGYVGGLLAPRARL
jgi:protein-tyrosine phosphatase